MSYLFIKYDGTSKNIEEKSFITEYEIEDTIYGTPGILKDIFILNKQIRGGNKKGIPDLIGIDKDKNICIIEMKNVTVDPSVISQIMKYAIWAEMNPDSVKGLYDQYKNIPEEYKINWNNKYQVRIIVIAPRILETTVDLVDKISWKLDLIEVKRWLNDEELILSVNELHPEKKKRPKAITPTHDYTPEYYYERFDKQTVDYFFKVIEQINEIITRKTWSLSARFNNNYCCFKKKFMNAFYIKFVGYKKLGLFIKATRKNSENFLEKITKYDQGSHEAFIMLDPQNTNIQDLEQLLEMAYLKINK